MVKKLTIRIWRPGDIESNESKTGGGGGDIFYYLWCWSFLRASNLRKWERFRSLPTAYRMLVIRFMNLGILHYDLCTHFFFRKRLCRCKLFLYRAYFLEQSSLDEMTYVLIIKLCTCIITLFFFTGDNHGI